MVLKVAIEVQGSLVSVGWRGGQARPATPNSATRGRIFGFSRKSRMRLMKLFARLSPARTTFVTLTYRSVPEPRVAKYHLNQFLKDVAELWPAASGIWRAELQKRGAAHFHILFFNLPYVPQEHLRDLWCYVTGEEAGVNIQLIKNFRHGLSYVSKYVTKENDNKAFLEVFKIYVLSKHARNGGAGGSLFIHMPYLATLFRLGRTWGVHGRGRLPLAALFVINEPVERYEQARVVFDITRYLRRAAGRPRAPANKGITLFTDNASDWLRIITSHLGQDFWRVDESQNMS